MTVVKRKKAIGIKNKKKMCYKKNLNLKISKTL